MLNVRLQDLSPRDHARGGVLEAAMKRHTADLDAVDGEALLERALRSAPAGAPLGVLRDLVIHTASALTFEEIQYSRVAARFLADDIHDVVAECGATCFSESIAVGRQQGVINERLAHFVTHHRAVLDESIELQGDYDYEYFGLRTLRDRYLLKHPETRKAIETPQYFLMRVACGVSDTLEEALELYRTFRRMDYMPSSPTLFNAGTHREQLSSCFLLDSPQDDLTAIYKTYSDVAMLSKFAGGIGLAYHRIRSEGSHIKGTNGLSRGVVPFLNTLDASVAAVNQGGRRKGACCVYLEPWHADIESFLELRENTGDEARRTHNLNLSNWICDLFMRRVEAGEMWSLFDPKEVPELIDTYGPTFEAIYLEAEEAQRYVRQVPARELYGRMMRTLAQTGNGWMCFKDASNLKCNQTGTDGRVVHLSNLCTEIIEITNDKETAVCNLGSINLARHTTKDGVDWEKLGNTVRIAVRQLDRVIDRNWYPIPETEYSNKRWRPVGLGYMGLQDVFFKLGLDFDSNEAKELSRRIAQYIYFNAVETSVELAEEKGAHPTFSETRASKGHLQPDLWGEDPERAIPTGGQADLFRTGEDYPQLNWQALRERVKRSGMRNSLLVAIAPTATIASIVGCFECIEPQVSNLFKRETLSGEFLQINRYLVADLKKLGLWTAEMRQQIKAGQGSVQDIEEIPEDLRRRYRTAWELSMKDIIDLAAGRGAYIDQSQSLNLFAESPTIGRLSSMYMYAWKSGLKTTYYLRSRPATRIQQTGTTTKKKVEVAAPEAVACSLENPEYCDACQ